MTDDDYYYSYFKPSKPIETDQGIRAKSKRGEFVKNWWADRWVKALEQLVNPGRLRRGKRYARQGQVLSIEETKKGIKAKVQGSRGTPYQVTIEMNTLTDKEWDSVIASLAGQAIFSAQLLAGEMPQEIEDVFAAARVSLFPEARNALKTSCSCPDPQNPCKHIAAVHYILGEQFDEDPFLLFRLRGRSQEQILSALRTQRSTEGAARIDRTQPEEQIVSLTKDVANFWEMGRPTHHIRTNISPAAAPLPVLKRLGQPSFLDESIEDVLGPAYRSVTEAAVALAFDQDSDDEETEAD